MQTCTNTSAVSPLSNVTTPATAQLSTAEARRSVEQLEKHLYRQFGLDSIDAGEVGNALYKVLMAKAKRDRMRHRLSPANLKTMTVFMEYLKQNYPITDAMAYGIGETAANLFFPAKAREYHA